MHGIQCTILISSIIECFKNIKEPCDICASIHASVLMGTRKNLREYRSVIGNVIHNSVIPVVQSALSMAGNEVMSMPVLGHLLLQPPFLISFPLCMVAGLINLAMPTECMESAFFRPFRLGVDSLSL